MAAPAQSIFSGPSAVTTGIFASGTNFNTGLNFNQSNEEGLRRLREEFLHEVRRDQRDVLLKRQQPAQSLKTESQVESKESEDIPEDPQILELVKTTEQMDLSLISLETICKGITSSNVAENIQGLVILREKILKEFVSLQEVVDANLVQHLIIHLENQTCPRIALEACWCIANICTGDMEHITSLVNKGLFQILPKILNHPRKDIFEQGAWAVGNIAADQGGYRYKLQTHATIKPLIDRLFTTKSPKEIEYITWVLCNLVKNPEGQKSFQLEERKLALPALFYLFRIIENSETLDEVVSTIVNVVDDGVLGELRKNQAVERAIHVLRNNKPSIALIGSILQMFNLISSGTDEDTSYLIEQGVPEVLFNLLLSPEITNPWAQRECLWILSNIVAGTAEQRAVIISREAWVDIFFQYTTHQNALIVREALWILCNSTKRCSLEHAVKLARKGFLVLLRNAIVAKPPAEFLETCLEALNQILRIGVPTEPRKPNQFQLALEESGMLDTLEELQFHPNQMVYERTANLIELYFQVHDPVV